MSVLSIGLVSALFGIIAVSLIFIVVTYNGFVQLKNNIDKTWSNIDVLLKQRYDEIPKLVEICKGYMKHEKETLEAVIKARNMLGNAKGYKEYLNSQSELSGALKSLFAVAEKYPELRADTMFARLQSRITELEDSIADRREMYNEVVKIYNIKTEKLPDMIVASLFKFSQSTLWEINPAHRSDVKIDFS